MLHRVAHSVPPGWLIHDWREALELWTRLLALGPAKAIAIMPDHVHHAARSIDPDAWHGVMSGYARWRNHHRDEPGRRVWLPSPPPEEIKGAKHLQRTVRYVHLNPCRDKLAPDPLAWPFTTHLDAVGLAVPGVLPRHRDPPWFHAYVSGDPSVRTEGTDLPYGRHGMAPPTVTEVEAAVSALTRTPLDDLRTRGPARTLFIQALLSLTTLTKSAIAAEIGVSHSTVVRASEIPSPTLAVIERVLGDTRFEPLYDGDLTWQPAWQRYRDRRIRSGAYDRLLQQARPALSRRVRSKRP